MRFMTAQDMKRSALADALKRTTEENRKRGGESGHCAIESPDGLSKLSCHSWLLTSFSFTLLYRDSTSKDWSHAGSYQVDEDFAEGFLKALNIPVKE